MNNLFKPYISNELEDLNDILKSGSLSYNNWGRKFEKLIEKFVGVKNVVSTNTYSNAINVALATLGLKPGDEVIASPMSCVASNMPLLNYGLKIKWCDIDPKTGTLSPDYLRTIISKRTKLIVHNHFCGYVGYVDEINDIARNYSIPVIDDCIEAFGSEYKGKKVGNLKTDITIFSFQTVRLPNTIEGGAIIFNSEELYEKSLLLRDLGINRKNFRDDFNEISESCDIITPGYAAMPNEVSSYFGCVQMNEIEKLLVQQNVNANNLSIWLDSKYPEIYRMNSRKEINPNYWVFGIIVDNKIEMLKKFRELGFYASGVHIKNNIYSVFDSKIDLEGVNEFNNKFLALPSGWWINN